MKVLTGRDVCVVISERTAAESIPPLRNAPRGTSDRRRIRTASVSSPRRRSIAAAAGIVSCSGASGHCQNGWTVVAPLEASTVIVAPGGNRRIPSNTAVSPATYPNVKKLNSAPELTPGLFGSALRIAFVSEPNSSSPFFCR